MMKCDDVTCDVVGSGGLLGVIIYVIITMEDELDRLVALYRQKLSE